MIDSRDLAAIKIKEVVDRVPFKEKSATLNRLAVFYGMKPGTARYRIQKIFGRTRPVRSDSGKRKNPEIEDVVKQIFEEKAKIVEKGETQRTIGTKTVIDMLVSDGKLQKGKYDARYINKIARQMGITLNKPCLRLAAKYSGACMVTDGSGSEYTCVVDDNWLKIRTNREKPQKNKRIKNNGDNEDTEDKQTRQIVYLYGFIDYHSGAVFVDAVITSGENTFDHVRAFEAACKIKPDHFMVGLPERIFSDNGPLCKKEGFALLTRLGVEVITHKPYNSRAKGLIERFWRTLWQEFELTLVRHKGDIISFDDYKRMLKNYVAEYNDKLSTGYYAKGRSRKQAYIEGLRPGQVRPLAADESLVALLEQTAIRTITAYCTVQWDGGEYEIVNCPAIMIGQKVCCRRSICAGVEVRRPDTLEWLTTKEFMPIEVGTYRKYKNDINTEITESAKIAPAPEKYLYEERPEAAPADEKIVALASYGQEAETRRVEPLRGFANAVACWSYMADKLGDPAWMFVPESMRDKLSAAIELQFENREYIEMLLASLIEVRDERDALERQSNNA